MLRVNIAFVFLLTLTCQSFGAIKNKQQVVPFGKNDQLIVNTNTGLFSLKHNGKLVVTNASAEFTTSDSKYQTKDYEKRSVKIEAIHDKIGRGKLLILTSLKAGAPVMIQRFYCYPSKEFVITEVEINGHDLSSNYIAP
jgi:alpha-galactosidase